MEKPQYYSITVKKMNILTRHTDWLVKTQELYNQILEFYYNLYLDTFQEKGIQPVEYILTGESGPDHDKQFTVSVQVNGQVVGNGTGHTKKAAEQAAAYQAIQEKKF